MQATACPPTQKLRAYLSGKLDQESSDLLSNHLTVCSDCERTLVDLEQEPDSLVELLQASPASPLPENIVVNQFGQGDGNSPSSLSIHKTPVDHHTQPDPFLTALPSALGQYELQSRLGVGGMGAVYLARHRSLDKHVAVKLLPALPAENAEFVARFQREMRAAGQLEHPAIVRTTDAGDQQGIHFLVMDYIDGMNLSSIARAEEKLSIADACEMIRQAAIGLAHAHEKGIVHRDVKPSNLMLDTAGQVRILDFGLAQIGCWESGTAEITTVGQLMGTLDYMAPEQAERGGAVDYRADLYALGATLFRLLTGRAPLAAAPNLTPLEKLRLLSSHKPPKLRSLRPDASESLAKIVDAMLAREPGLRPASATHVAELLEPFGQGADLVDLLKRARSKPLPRESQSINPCSLLARDLNPAGANPVDNTSASPQPLLATLSSSTGHGFTRWLTWTGLAGFAATIVAGVLFVIETSKGQLVIDSNVDVQVKIVKLEDDKQAEVEQLQIQPGTQTTRLRSGKYIVTLDSASDSFSVTNGTFEIRNGQTVIASITPKSNIDSSSKLAEGAASETQQPAEASDKRLTETVYDGETLRTWLERLNFERNPEEITRTLKAISALSEPQFRELMEKPLSDFLVRKNSFDDVQSACRSLAAVVGKDFPETLNSILKRQASPATQLSLLSATDIAVVARHVLPESEFISTVSQIITNSESNSNQQIDAAGYLRALADLHRGDPRTDLQKRVLNLLVQAGKLKDDTFWLTIPVDYKFRYDFGNRVYYHELSMNSLMQAEVVRRALSVVADEDCSNKTYVQAVLFLRTVIANGVARSDGFELSDSQLAELSKGLVRVIAHCARNTEMAKVEVTVPQQLRRFAVPIYSLGELPYDENEPTSQALKANMLISTLNLVYVGKLEQNLTTELAQLHESFRTLPLFGNTHIESLRTPKRLTWTYLLEQISWNNYFPNRVVFLQSGLLLGKKETDLFARFETEMPVDQRLRLENELSRTEQSNYQNFDWNSFARASANDFPPRTAEVMGNYLTKYTSHFSNELTQHVNQWCRASGGQFLANYGNALKNANEMNRNALLQVDVSNLENLTCTAPQALTPLLEFASEIYAQSTKATSSTNERVPNQFAAANRSSNFDPITATTNTLTSLLIDNGKVSIEAQQRIVEFLESQSQLTDSSFWLTQPNNAKTDPHYGSPMRQAILKRAIGNLQEVNSAEGVNSAEYTTQCQALAVIETAIQGGDSLSDAQRKEVIMWASAQLQILAKNDLDPQARVVVLESQLFHEPFFTDLSRSEVLKARRAEFLQSMMNSRSRGGREPNTNSFVQLQRPYANKLVLYLNVLAALKVQENPAEMEMLRADLEALHQKIEAKNIMGIPVDDVWRNIRSEKSSATAELVMHTWYVQTGLLLSKDFTKLNNRPNELLQAYYERQQRFVQPRDTLSIYIPEVLPRSGEPPVIQAGKSRPVTGFPVPVSSEGFIELPHIAPLQVKELDLAQVKEAIEKAYFESKILKEKPLGVTVQFLLRSNESEELRNIAGNGSVSISGVK
ncbi:MAG: protein kinase [Pirellulales bacterium]